MPTATKTKPAGSLADLQSIRDRIAQLQAERSRISDALLPEDEALRKLDAAIQYWGSQARISVGPCVNGADKLDEFIIPGSSRDAGLTASLCYLFPDQIRAVLAKDIKRTLSHEKPGLPLADRPNHVEAIEQKLRELEEHEEDLVCALEMQGLDVWRRAGASLDIALHASEGRKAELKQYQRLLIARDLMLEQFGTVSDGLSEARKKQLRLTDELARRQADYEEGEPNGLGKQRTGRAREADFNFIKRELEEQLAEVGDQVTQLQQLHDSMEAKHHDVCGLCERAEKFFEERKTQEAADRAAEHTRETGPPMSTEGRVRNSSSAIPSEFVGEAGSSGKGWRN